MSRGARLLLFALGLLCVGGVPSVLAQRLVEVGADLSSLPRVEAQGATFSDSAGAADAIALLARNGVGSIRLRLWHSPANGECGLDSTLAVARRAHAAGLRVLLDLHFSDTWADPSHQAPPAAWNGLPVRALAESAGAYAQAAVAALVAQDTPPEAVQIGNEVDAGLLWDTARVGERFDSRGHWAAFASVLTAAANGVHAACPAARVIVHLAAGGNRAACERTLDRLVSAKVPFDVIGLSYYPWWHGPLDSLAANLGALASRYKRDVAVVETGYPWTLGWYDDQRNLIGQPWQLLPGFPASPEGQAAFAHAVRRIVEEVPQGRGAGVWWWEPAWIATSGGGSPWENCTLFDSNGAALPALRALTHP